MFNHIHILFSRFPRLTPGCTATLFSLLTLQASTLCSQVVDTIQPSPGAVLFREVWHIKGRYNGEMRGAGARPVGDNNGDGIGDFIVGSADSAGDLGIRYRLYYGGTPPQEGSWNGKAYEDYPMRTGVGDFWGDGHNSLVLHRSVYILDIYRWDSVRGFKTERSAYVQGRNVKEGYKDIQGIDLDGDGYQEMVATNEGEHKAVMFWRGGVNFPSDTPNAETRNVLGGERSGIPGVYFGDFDGDGALDMLAFGAFNYNQLFFFWGRKGQPFQWEPFQWATPDRVVTLYDTVHFKRDAPGIAVLDCDGDGVKDIAMGGQWGKTYLFRSRTGKNARTRDYTPEDADALFYASAFDNPWALGYPNDVAHKYEMLQIVVGINFQSNFKMGGLSGGPDGSDKYYELTSGESWGLSPDPTGDLTGDGWDDGILGTPTGADGSTYGAAGIFAGGPYIPTDDPRVGVEPVAVTGEDQPSLFVFPQPAHDVLTIAWHGNMKRFPARFTVHDALGRLVAISNADFRSGSAQWNCAQRPAGVYQLRIYDNTGMLIGAKMIIRQ